MLGDRQFLQKHKFWETISVPVNSLKNNKSDCLTENRFVAMLRFTLTYQEIEKL